MTKDPVEAFACHLAEERGLPPSTVRAYRRDLEAFQAFRGEVPWERVDRQMIRGFVGECHGRGLSARSLQRTLAALRTFYRYLIREGRLLVNPAEGVPAPRQGRPLPSTLAPDQVCELLQRPGQGFEGLRDRALLELLYASGLRVAEAFGLDVVDLDWQAGQAVITGKRGKKRWVPVGRKAFDALRAYLPARQQQIHPGETALFVTRRGRRMAIRTMQDRIRKLSAGAASPHTLRHSCATHLLESSGNLRAVQELMGHAHLGTTQIYTHLDAQHLAAVYDATHPRARRASPLDSGKVDSGKDDVE